MGRPDFGIQIEPQYGFSYDSIKEIAINAERNSLESIWVSDHFFLTPELQNTHCLECWTTLTALSRDTKKIRLGTMVTSQSYRNPALLAKIASSLDNISGGRLNFGIGAGWKQVEYNAYNYKFPSSEVRIRQLDEALEIVKLMWSEEKATFKGKFYSVREVICSPKPIQPNLPIWVGGTGRMTLKIAAKHADAVNFAWTLPLNRVTECLNTLRNRCDQVGTNYDRIIKSAGLMLITAESSEKLQEKLKRREAQVNSPYQRYLNRQPPNLIGTIDYVLDRIDSYRKLGINHFILRFHFGEEIEGIRLYKDHIEPSL